MTTTYRRQTAPRIALRELLEGTLEWGGRIGPAKVMTEGGVRYRLSPLTSGAGGFAVLCEGEPGHRVPEYAIRRRIRRRIADARPPNLTIFTDAAHSVLVWSWFAAGRLGERTYREISLRPGDAWGPLRPILESIARGRADPEPSEERGSAGRGARAAMLSALDARISAGAAAGAAEAQAVQDAIEWAEGPDEIRACWDGLLACRVFDPSCGEGTWLDSARDAFASAYEACLERMRCELDDVRRSHPPPRRTRLGDLARLVERAGSSRQPSGPRRFTTELALLHNIFGTDSEPGSVELCRERLVSALEPLGGSANASLLAMNVRAHWSRPGGASDEVELVNRAVATILRMHLEGTIGVDELSRAMAAASQRIEDDAIRREGPGADPEARADEQERRRNGFLRTAALLRPGIRLVRGLEAGGA